MVGRESIVGQALKDKRQHLLLKIAWNYLVLLVCAAGFHNGVWMAFLLPVVQIILSCFNYQHSSTWRTVLWLEMHLLVSTAAGIYLEGYLYLRYVSGDAESVLAFREMLKIEAFLALGIGIITTVIKWISARAVQKNG